MSIVIKKNPTPPAEANATRILIVDDEQAMQLLASAIVKRLGHQAKTVGSGEEALEEFKRAAQLGAPYDIVVMDLALPGGMSGLEATIALKQINHETKVIVSSGYLEQNARAAAIQHGFAGILPKPYTADRLASEIRYVLREEGETA